MYLIIYGIAHVKHSLADLHTKISAVIIDNFYRWISRIAVKLKTCTYQIEFLNFEFLPMGIII